MLSTSKNGLWIAPYFRKIDLSFKGEAVKAIRFLLESPTENGGELQLEWVTYH